MEEADDGAEEAGMYLMTVRTAVGPKVFVAPVAIAVAVLIRMIERLAVRECAAVVLFNRSADRAAIIIACRCCTGGSRLQRFGADGFHSIAVIAYI